MARLIDAEPYDELLEQRSVQLRDEMGSIGGAVSGCRKLLAIQPTIDPVHAAGGCYCRECRYLQQDTHGLWCFRDYENPLKLDGFCSYGIRREENGE